jgi:hypothetical protein
MRLLRMTIRQWMILVASLAVSIPWVPYIYPLLQRSVWWGDGGSPFGPATLWPYIHRPRLGFLLIPALSLLAVWSKPPLRVIWMATALDVVALLLWLLLERWMGAGPGHACIWPDSFYPLLIGRYDASLRVVYAPWYQFLRPSTQGELVDLLSLLWLLILLASMLVHPFPRRLRALTVLAITGYYLGEWLLRMYTDRYLGFGQAPFIPGGLGPYQLPRPTVTDLVKGSLLGMLCIYIVVIQFDQLGLPSRRICKR